MFFPTVMMAAALLTPQEAELKARLPEVFAQAAANYRALDAVAVAERYGDRKKEGQLPRSWDARTGKVLLREWHDWTGGHYPGALLYLYEATGDAFFAERAKDTMPLLARNAKVATNHDVGFIMYCSYGNARRLFKTTEYDALLLETASTLCTRYNSRLGLIRSWGKVDEKRDFLVIPDNLMNLELLEWASKAPGGDARFDRIARSHANMTDRHHYRADSSCYHVLDYDQETGRVQGIKRGQGASVESAWSRGQSWSVYGFTMMYRETREKAFLARACRCADFAINHPNMPPDGVPCWDYGAPGEERDSSAAAIQASALLELASFAPDPAAAARYRAFAVKTLLALTSPTYFARADEQGGFLLKHGVGAKPLKSEIDVPLNYGDYYFLEALLRLRAWVNARRPFTDRADP